MSKTKWYAKPIYLLVALALVLSLGIVALPKIASAAELHVGPGQTYTTIQDAINAASPGDTITVAAGTYNERIAMKDGVTVEGAGPGASIIDGTDSATPAAQCYGVVSFKNIVGSGAIRGFTIRWRGATSSPWQVDGISISGPYLGYDYHGTPSITIENNHVSTVRGNGIAIMSGSQYVLIKNNVIAAENHPTWTTYTGLAICWYADVDVINNVVYGWNQQGIHSWQWHKTRVKNTIVSDCAHGVIAHPMKDAIKLSYSDVWNISPGVKYQNVDSAAPANNNIEEDPLFINPTGDPLTWDFHLQLESPCKGTGDGTDMGLLPPPPPPLPMASFVIDHAKLDFKSKPNDDKVDVKGTLTLDEVSGNGVSISEDVTVTVGTTLSQTIKMEQKGKEGETWEYKCPKDDGGIIKHMTINWKNGKFDFCIDKVDLSGLTNPDEVIIGIQIGNDVGKTTISMTETKHWDYKAK